MHTSLTHSHKPRGCGDISLSSGGAPSRGDQVETNSTTLACVSRVLGIEAASEGLPGPVPEERPEAASTGERVRPGQVASEGQASAVILCQGQDEVRHGGAHMPSPHSHPRTTCGLEKGRLSPHPEVSPLISRRRSSQEMLPLWPDDIDWGKAASIPE